jgi:hypothetical protein
MIQTEQLIMPPLKQAIEVSVVAKVIYNILMIAFDENERKGITEIAREALNEPVTQFNLSRYEIAALINRVNDIEKISYTAKRNIVQELFHNKSRLTAILFLHHFINRMDEIYVDIPDGTKLMEVINFIFDYANKWEEMGVTQEDMEAANKEALIIDETLMQHFKKKRCFMDN